MAASLSNKSAASLNILAHFTSASAEITFASPILLAFPTAAKLNARSLLKIISFINAYST